MESEPYIAAIRQLAAEATAVRRQAAALSPLFARLAGEAREPHQSDALSDISDSPQSRATG